MEQVPRGLPVLAVCVVLTVGCAGLERRGQQGSSTQASVQDAAPPPKPALRGLKDEHLAKPEMARPRATAKPAAPPPVVPPPARAQPPALIVVKPAAVPPLDLKSLEVRLRETKAISTLSKIALKNQMDDLLERFKGFYEGRIKTSLVELRRAFDLLVMKTLALLQDADPPLAGALASSRESIWGVLSDPVKLNAL
jgi:hypothetical protein